VLYSAARSSGTTYENPVIADVDGDFHSEIVSAVNDYAGALGCPATDPLRPSATYAQNHGVVVLRDELDRWAASRPVWNQHAYAVSHVGDRGEIPRTSAVTPNWSDPALNSFRQNVQGDLESLGVPDLTAASEVGPLEFLCDPTRLEVGVEAVAPDPVEEVAPARVERAQHCPVVGVGRAKLVERLAGVAGAPAETPVQSIAFAMDQAPAQRLAADVGRLEVVRDLHHLAEADRGGARVGAQHPSHLPRESLGELIEVDVEAAPVATEDAERLGAGRRAPRSDADAYRRRERGRPHRLDAGGRV